MIYFPSSNVQYAELEISLRRREAGGYPVEMRFFNLWRHETQFPDKEPKAYANINPDDLLLRPVEEQGRQLGRVMFAEESIRQGLEAARKVVENSPDTALRLRLYIYPAAKELHHLPWETLCDAAGVPLFRGTRILFSRYLNCRNPPAQKELRGKSGARALIVVAAHRDIQNCFARGEFAGKDQNDSLHPINVAKERKLAEEGFRQAGIAWKTLATGEPDSLGPATTDQILSQLDKGYDILYLVCHGGLTEDGEAVLFLEEGEVYAKSLVERIQHSQRLPRLIILASCESAPGLATVASGTLSAFGPQLIGAGIPAVVAMQGKVKMTTIAKFMPCFLAELAESEGQVDRAMGVARERAASADCLDCWMPVLFSRLTTGQLWDRPDPHSAVAESPRPPNRGRLVAKLCDRRAQEGAFSMAFEKALAEHPATPQLYFITGEEGQCHESLVERLIHRVDEHFSQHADQVSGGRRKSIPWHCDGTLEQRFSRLVYSLVEHLGPASFRREIPPGGLTPLAVDDLLRSARNHYIAIQHSLYEAKWDDATAGLLRRYADFWSGWPPSEQRPAIVVFFSIRFQQPGQVWWQKLLLTSLPARKRRQTISNTLADLERTVRVPCHRLAELPPVVREDVDEWFELNHIFSPAERLRALNRLFPSAGAPKPMAEIEEFCNEVLRNLEGAKSDHEPRQWQVEQHEPALLR
ncbi:MAG: CHAT domain-containing protein [Acidobacteria bacterium]|nr:CHAT domain-containing protein [Acidobacteriota bacterium]